MFKKKSLTLYGKSHSVNGIFQLNSKLRNPPPTLGRSIPRTTFKGTNPIGYGAGSTCRVGGRYARICGHGYPLIISKPQYEMTDQIPVSVCKPQCNIVSTETCTSATSVNSSSNVTYKNVVELITCVKPVYNPYNKSVSRCTPYTKDVSIPDQSTYLKMSSSKNPCSFPTLISNGSCSS